MGEKNELQQFTKTRGGLGSGVIDKAGFVAGGRALRVLIKEPFMD